MRNWLTQLSSCRWPSPNTAERPGFSVIAFFWYGFIVAGFIDIWHGLAFFFPSLPDFSVRHNARNWGKFFTDRPWSAIGYTSMSFNLAIVGLTYFMPLDLAFSTWFFFWLTRAEKVFADIIGWQNMHLNDRATGGWIGIALIALWGARRHLATLIKHIFSRHVINDNSEPVSYGATLILTVLSIGLVFLFCYTVCQFYSTTIIVSKIT